MLYPLLRSVLFAVNPETAHKATLFALDAARCGRLIPLFAKPPENLPVTALGLHFPNPVGLAAGLDKNAEHLAALGALGFGFIEVGTTTPRAQPGNDRPRMFRLPKYEAIINRLGFNNTGVDALVRNVQKSHYRGVLGINIGKNKDTPNDKAIDDYLFCLKRVYPHASYVTVNISSPNTEGLRDLQQGIALHRLVGRLREAQEQLGSQSGTHTPMLFKIAPDLDEAALDTIATVALDAKVDGLICTNTTVDHAAVAGDPRGNETGGLSGKPLLERATAVLRAMRQRVGERITLIGVGGILDGNNAAEKLAAGATLVQIYTGLIYRGPFLITECVNAIRRQRQSPHA